MIEIKQTFYQNSADSWPEMGFHSILVGFPTSEICNRVLEQIIGTNLVQDLTEILEVFLKNCERIFQRTNFQTRLDEILISELYFSLFSKNIRRDYFNNSEL